MSQTQLVSVPVPPVSRSSLPPFLLSSPAHLVLDLATLGESNEYRISRVTYRNQSATTRLCRTNRFWGGISKPFPFGGKKLFCLAQQSHFNNTNARSCAFIAIMYTPQESDEIYDGSAGVRACCCKRSDAILIIIISTSSRYDRLCEEYELISGKVGKKKGAVQCSDGRSKGR